MVRPRMIERGINPVNAREVSPLGVPFPWFLRDCCCFAAGARWRRGRRWTNASKSAARSAQKTPA